MENHKPVLIIIAGPNGSGKTTITQKVLHHEWLENAIYINPDQIAKDKFGDWNSVDAVLKSANYCQQLREKCLEDGQSLIFETVMSAPDKVDFPSPIALRFARLPTAHTFTTILLTIRKRGYCSECPTANFSSNIPTTFRNGQG